MSTDEYVPDEQEFIDSWACAHVTPQDMTAEEAKDVARAFLARVRRDAAREALDGLIAWHRENAQDAETPAPVRRGIAVMADEAQRYRDTHYPEETP